MLRTIQNGMLIFKYMAPLFNTTGLVDPDKKCTKYLAVRKINMLRNIG